ncbi:MAG: helix-turn-helix transcriptional regulator [Burkholderiales bacterium]|nr:helix-turn-helix transcriptional regulator [Burkholderiales bacterium]
MAKIMKPAAPGALAEALKTKRMTQADLAKKGQFSRNTLRDINAGKAVKSDTLDSVAKHLGTPVEHLLPKEAATPQIPSPAAGSVGGPADAGRPSPMRRPVPSGERRLNEDGLLVKAIGPEDIEFELLWISRVTWSLDSKIPREAHSVLRELEFSLKETMSAKAVGRGADFGELEGQLREIEAWDAIKAIVVRLQALGVHLLAGSYLYWKCDAVHDPYEGNLTAYDYSSRMTVRLHVAPINVKVDRALVHEGQKPPKYSPRRGPAVYVNDTELPREPVEASATDDPSADTANDDDMPF